MSCSICLFLKFVCHIYSIIYFRHKCKETTYKKHFRVGGGDVWRGGSRGIKMETIILEQQFLKREKRKQFLKTNSARPV